MGVLNLSFESVHLDDHQCLNYLGNSHIVAGLLLNKEAQNISEDTQRRKQ